jgi:hypothetical protein
VGALVALSPVWVREPPQQFLPCGKKSLLDINLAFREPTVVDDVRFY